MLQTNVIHQYERNTGGLEKEYSFIRFSAACLQSLGAYVKLKVTQYRSNNGSKNYTSGYTYNFCDRVERKKKTLKRRTE